MIEWGMSPAIEKQRKKHRLKEAKSFGEFGEKWLTAAPMAHSTRAMRRAIFERELLLHARDIVKQIYGFAILHGEKVANPADEVGPASIATFVRKDRPLWPAEIRIMLKQLAHVATMPTEAKETYIAIFGAVHG